MHSMIDSAFRHLMKYMDGQDDEDHLCAAATNLLMAMWTEEKMPEMQDIPTRGPSVASLKVSCAETTEHPSDNDNATEATKKASSYRWSELWVTETDD